MARSNSNSVRAVETTEVTSLPRIFPALPSLPLPLTPFLGRNQERADILAMLRRNDVRLLVLTGPGGIGKTRMAIESAHVAAADFRHGATFAGLVAISDPKIVPTAIAESLNLPELTDHSALSSISSGLGDREVLIVIDNFEQVVSAAPVLTAILQACPMVKLMVTSRERLDVIGEHLYPISALPIPEEAPEPDLAKLESNAAVSLFLQSVKAVRPDFHLTKESAPSVIGICRQLEGWPLALELAAARSTALSMPALLSRLNNRLTMLAGGPRDGQIRFRSMRDAIAWSYNLLEPGDQALFAKFTVFNGGCSLEAAEAVLADPADSTPVFDRIESLVNKCLIRMEPGESAEARYYMLETIREFGAEILAARGETETLRDKHALCFTEMAKTGGWNLKTNEALIWLPRLVADRDNFRAALTWLEHTGRIDRFLNMATYLATFWDYRGELNEGRLWLDRAFERLELEHSPAESIARAKSWLGWFQFRQGELDGAYASLTEALPLWIASGHREGQAYAHAVLGTIEQTRGYFAEARRNIELARDLFDECNEIPGGIETTLNLSDLDYQTGDNVAALEKALIALERSEKEDIRTYIAVSNVAVAQSKNALGDPVGALEAARSGMAVARELGFTACFADALCCTAAIAASLGQLELASNLLGAAEAALKSTGGARFFYHHQFQRTVDNVRQGLGSARYDRDRERGLTLADADVLSLVESLVPEQVENSRAALNLTKRESEVLALLAAGKSDKEIAGALFITYRTANAYVAKVLDKLNVPSRTAAAAFAIREGLV